MHHAHTWSKAGKEIAEGWAKSRKLVAESSNTLHESQSNWLHKCRDPERMPWQQFLHSNSPGSGLDQSTFPKVGCTQILTHAGMELLRGWLEKHEDVERQISLVRS